MKLNESIMKVKLSTSQWTARKADNEVSDEVDAKHGTIGAGTFNKRLAPASFLAEIRAAYSALDQFHKKMTTPWDDEGWRALKCTAHPDYSEGVRKLKSDIRDAEDNLVSNYARFIENEKIRLRGLFKANDYPKLTEIGEKWGVRIKIRTIDDEENVLLRISDDALAEIKLGIQEERDAAEQKTMSELWGRIYEPVKKLADRLEEPELKGNKSLVGNIIDLVNLLPNLNVFDNPDLEVMRREVEDKLCRHSVKKLKLDDDAFAETRDAAREIVDKMAGYMS